MRDTPIIPQVYTPPYLSYPSRKERDPDAPPSAPDHHQFLIKQKISSMILFFFSEGVFPFFTLRIKSNLFTCDLFLSVFR